MTTKLTYQNLSKYIQPLIIIILKKIHNFIEKILYKNSQLVIVLIFLITILVKIFYPIMYFINMQAFKKILIIYKIIV